VKAINLSERLEPRSVDPGQLEAIRHHGVRLPYTRETTHFDVYLVEHETQPSNLRLSSADLMLRTEVPA